MQILFLSSEVAPFSKTGGLGDVAGALPQALARLGHRVRVVSPLYQSVPRDTFQRFGAPVTLTFPFGSLEVQTWRAPGEVEWVFIECARAFDRPGIYGHGDDARRFTLLAMAALSTALRDGFDADVVHANDWPTALALLALRTGYAHTPLGRARRVFTIHNLAYQGIAPKQEVEALGIPWSLFSPEGVEFYEHLSFMKAGLVSADVITTVSPQYAKEIQTQRFGHGLEGLIKHRRGALHGILNGVDTEAWNPATDVFLKARYSAQDVSPRAQGRSELLASCRIDAPVAGMPLFGVVSRLTQQKGIDLILSALPRLLEQGASAVVLGAGDEALQKAWQALAARYPKRLHVRLGFDESLAHRIEAGVDFFVMPSRFEPCGLNQMYSLLYGAVPIVHGVGGLKDTVVDISRENGTGVVFDTPSGEALYEALVRAVTLFRDPARYAAVQRRGMVQDFGWARAASQYEALYRP